MLSKEADDMNTCYLKVLGGRSIVSAADGDYVEAKTFDVLAPL